MCRAKDPETGEGRLCPSNGGPLPADMDEHERERILQARREAVRDRVARLRFQHEAQRKEIQRLLSRVPADRREQVIRDMLTDDRYQGRGKAGYRKALAAELRVIQRRRGELAGL